MCTIFAYISLARKTFPNLIEGRFGNVSFLQCTYDHMNNETIIMKKEKKIDIGGT